MAVSDDALLRYNPRRHFVSPKPAVGRKLESHDGAMQLAADIEKFWADRGFSQVKCTVERNFNHNRSGHEPTWFVKSNLHNGLPPKVTS
jgi:hypothetical protein